MRQRISKINTREELAIFVDELRFSLKGKKGEWENKDLSSYLEAMSAWITDMDGYYDNCDEQLPENVPWKVFAEILYAAKIYE